MQLEHNIWNNAHCQHKQDWAWQLCICPITTNLTFELKCDQI